MEHIPIAQLTPALPSIQSKQIRAVVTLIWPFSSSTRQCALLLAEPDFRLRRHKGQVRVRFLASSARALAETGVGIGDEVILGMNGAQFVDQVGDIRTPGKSIDWELTYSQRLVVQLLRDGREFASLDIDKPTETPATLSPIRPRVSQTAFEDPVKGQPQWSSPAFLKRSRLSDSAFFEAGYDPLAENGDGNTAHRDKRRRRSSRNWTAFTYLARTPSPEKEDALLKDWDSPTRNEVNASPSRTIFPQTPVSPSKPPAKFSVAAVLFEEDEPVEAPDVQVVDESDATEISIVETFRTSNVASSDPGILQEDVDYVEYDELYAGPDEYPPDTAHQQVAKDIDCTTDEDVVDDSQPIVQEEFVYISTEEESEEDEQLQPAIDEDDIRTAQRGMPDVYNDTSTERTELEHDDEELPSISDVREASDQISQPGMSEENTDVRAEEINFESEDDELQLPDAVEDQSDHGEVPPPAPEVITLSSSVDSAEELNGYAQQESQRERAGTEDDPILMDGTSEMMMPPPGLPLLQTDFNTSAQMGARTPIGDSPISPALKPLDSATLPLVSPFPGEHDTTTASFLEDHAFNRPLGHVPTDELPTESDSIVETSFHNSVSSHTSANQSFHESAFTEFRFSFGFDGSLFSRPRAAHETKEAVKESSPVPHEDTDIEVKEVGDHSELIKKETGAVKMDDVVPQSEPSLKDHSIGAHKSTIGQAPKDTFAPKERKERLSSPSSSAFFSFASENESIHSPTLTGEGPASPSAKSPTVPIAETPVNEGKDVSRAQSPASSIVKQQPQPEKMDISSNEESEQVFQHHHEESPIDDVQMQDTEQEDELSYQQPSVEGLPDDELHFVKTEETSKPEIESHSEDDKLVFTGMEEAVATAPNEEQQDQQLRLVDEKSILQSDVEVDQNEHGAKPTDLPQASLSGPQEDQDMDMSLVGTMHGAEPQTHAPIERQTEIIDLGDDDSDEDEGETATVPKTHDHPHPSNIDLDEPMASSTDGAVGVDVSELRPVEVLVPQPVETPQDETPAMTIHKQEDAANRDLDMADHEQEESLIQIGMDYEDDEEMPNVSPTQDENQSNTVLQTVETMKEESPAGDDYDLERSPVKTEVTTNMEGSTRAGSTTSARELSVIMERLKEVDPAGYQRWIETSRSSDDIVASAKPYLDSMKSLAHAKPATKRAAATAVIEIRDMEPNLLDVLRPTSLNYLVHLRTFLQSMKESTNSQDMSDALPEAYRRLNCALLSRMQRKDAKGRMKSAAFLVDDFDSAPKCKQGFQPTRAQLTQHSLTFHPLGLLVPANPGDPLPDPELLADDDIDEQKPKAEKTDDEGMPSSDGDLQFSVPLEGGRIGQTVSIAVPKSAPYRNTRSKNRTSFSPTKEGLPAPRSSRSLSKNMSPMKGIKTEVQDFSDSSPPPSPPKVEVPKSWNRAPMAKPSGKFANVSYVKDSEEGSLHSDASVTTVQSSDNDTVMLDYEFSLGQPASQILGVDASYPGRSAPTPQRSQDISSRTHWKGAPPAVQRASRNETQTQPSFSSIRSKSPSEAADVEQRNRRQLSSSPLPEIWENPRLTQRRVLTFQQASQQQASQAPVERKVTLPQPVEDDQLSIPSSPPPESPKDKLSYQQSLLITPEQSQLRGDSQPALPQGPTEQSLPLTPQLTQKTSAGIGKWNDSFGDSSFNPDLTLASPLKRDSLANSSQKASTPQKPTRRSLTTNAVSSPEESAEASAASTDSEVEAESLPSPTIGLETKLAYYTPLTYLPRFLNRSSQSVQEPPDILALVVSGSTKPERAPKGPRHYFTSLQITDASTYPSQTTVQVFRPYEGALPIANAGDVVLLRRFIVKSLNRRCMLVSDDESAWCVWRYGRSWPVWGVKTIKYGEVMAREECRGPQVELGDGERGEVERFRGWWEGKVRMDVDKTEREEKGVGKGT